MAARVLRYLRVVIAVAACSVLAPAARADSWRWPEDVGVAAVDSRTGKVLWEVWRLDELPGGVSKEGKGAVEYLLAHGSGPDAKLPPVTPLPDVPVKDLAVKNPWPVYRAAPPAASAGKNLIYYRTGVGVIALDGRTKNEVWRLPTGTIPLTTLVLETGDNLTFVQIRPDVPATLRVGWGGDHLQMGNLQPHTLRQQAAAAALLRHYGDGYLRPEVRKLAERLRKGADEPAAKAVENLLADWPQRRDHQRLLAGCAAALLESDEGNPLREFTRSPATRVLLWGLLQELIYGRSIDGYSRQGYNYAYHGGWTEQPVSLTEATKGKLVHLCRKVVGEGPDAEKPFATSVLVSTAVGWGKLTDAERKGLFLSSDPSGWRWAALALAKNGRRELLMEWTRERPAGDHLDVIWILRHDKPKEWSEAELAFWLACARRNPGGVAYVLRLCDGPTPMAFREPTRSYLEREIAEPTIKDDGTHKVGYLFAAVYLLDSWKNADDTPLLLKYQKHPVPNLRAHVRSLLEKRGIKVPPDVGAGKE